MSFENSTDFKILDNLLKAHPNSSTRDLRKHLKDTFGDIGDNAKNIDLLFNEKNASLNLSALTSLATD
jgi:hypothetical protein